MHRFLTLLTLTVATLLSASYSTHAQQPSARIAQSKQDVKPFMAVPFPESLRDTVVVSEGWDYLHEVPLHPKIVRHAANDYKCPKGTPVLAAADGYAFASYHLVFLDDRFEGKRMGFGLGRFVQIWHPQAGVYTSYAHLNKIDESLLYAVYHAPQMKDSGWDPGELYRSVDDFLKIAVPVKKGQKIGEVGTSGLSLEGDGESPDKVDLPTWDPAGPHLHLEVYTRGLDGRGKVLRLDPFGIEGTEPAYKGIFKKPAMGLFLRDPKTGFPMFAG